MTQTENHRAESPERDLDQSLAFTSEDAKEPRDEENWPRPYGKLPIDKHMCPGLLTLPRNGSKLVSQIGPNNKTDCKQQSQVHTRPQAGGAQECGSASATCKETMESWETVEGETRTYGQPSEPTRLLTQVPTSALHVLFNLRQVTKPSGPQSLHPQSKDKTVLPCSFTDLGGGTRQ